MSEWETFCDVCYYDLWRVRRKDERGFNDGFHLQHGKEAKELVELLNKLERGEANTKLQEVSSKLAEALRERNEAREHWGNESMNAAQFFGEKTKAIAERDEARENLERIAKIAVSARKIQEDYAEWE